MGATPEDRLAAMSPEQRQGDQERRDEAYEFLRTEQRRAEEADVMGATPEPPGIAELEALHIEMENRRLCAHGHHAWTPWLAVHRGGMEANGISFYTTWCAREGCNHTEQWDCP